MIYVYFSVVSKKIVLYQIMIFTINILFKIQRRYKRSITYIF